MSDDQLAEAVGLGLMLAHLGALMWSGWLRKGVWSVVALNLLESAIIVPWWAPHFSESIVGFQVFVAFEIVVLAISLAVIVRLRIPVLLAWIAFVVNTVLLAAILVFMFTFHLTRLI